MKVSKTLRAIAAGLVCLMVMNTLAAEWQWSVPLGNGRAFLWIPPKCRQVRAVVVGQNNMIEEGILQHDYFRKQMAKLGIAEIYIAPPFETFQNSTNNDTANAQFDAMLKSLAGQSGYGELEFAPILPIGHSAMASYPWNFAAWNPARTLAILSVHGDAPQTTLVGNGRPNVDWGNRNIDGVPGLMVMGEYEWWEDRLARYPRLVPKDADCAAKLKKRTLTKLYNERPAWLDFAHKKLDAAVAAAYGWPADLTDEQILEKLLALNLERAAEEAKAAKVKKPKSQRAKSEHELI